MNKKFLNLLSCYSLFIAVIFANNFALAAQVPSTRPLGTVSTQRAEGNVKRTTLPAPSISDDAVTRSAVRRPTVAASRTAIVSPSVSGRTAARATVVSAGRSDTISPRTAATTNVVRSATQSPSSARSAVGTSNVSRAAASRATAVFDDVSKIGGGYATCREAYSTCMDQFCAKANDTYRRCYCSSRYSEFRDTEAALDEAKSLLVRFEDNNLNAVDKTIDEVNAMYSATSGESAIKNDPSAAASMLSEIGDLLSGKKKAGKSAISNSLSSLTIDFTADIGDIWGDNAGSNTFFGSGTGDDLSKLDGMELYNSANKQCLDLIKTSCENNAVLTMAKSSYSILIGQDCNAYEKKVNTQKELVQKTVRTAEQYLREARLDEYRTHNSADVNECIAKVRTAITADTACGTNYKKCLDYTGQYINVNTGDPIYSPRLFQLTGILRLENANGNIATSNPQFNKFMNDKQMFATKALDTCRDKSAVVWEEFKRAAMIEIAQAQDAKIEEVKNSCVSIMAECYDTQSGALASFDNTTAQASGALNAYAARAMCADKVAACAALYAGPNDKQCEFDSNGRLITTQCGLSALVSFVQTVDDVKVAEGCSTAIDGYVKSLCTPSAGNQEFPWNCRIKTPGTSMDNPSGAANASVAANIKQFALDNCSDPATARDSRTYDALPVQTRTHIENSITGIAEQLDYQMMSVCENLDGYWQDSAETTGTLLTAFYANVYGGTANISWGRCVQNDVLTRCLAYNTDEKTAATYDRNKDECVFSDSWYEVQCKLLGNGYYENGVCYVAN